MNDHEIECPNCGATIRARMADQPEHATLADGTVLRDLTVRQLADLRWDTENDRTYYDVTGNTSEGQN